MFKIHFIFYLAILLNFSGFPQPQLKIVPDNIEFKNDFDRLKNVYFINEGDQTLIIDSIYYINYNYYFLRFNEDFRYPIQIEPNDTIIMDCILTNAYPIHGSNTSDTMRIYSNGINSWQDIRIKIDYFGDEDNYGRINGFIKSDSIPLADATIYFLYDGSRIIQSVTSNYSGYFSAVLPPGQYIIAAKKDSFYVTFYGQSFTPYSAKLLNLKKDSIKNLNIDLAKMSSTGLSVEGQVIDSVSDSPVKFGMIVSRRGRHTPSKINFSNTNQPSNGYTAIIDYNGNYKIENIASSGYYIVQGFSDYYVPSYYRSGNSTAFWQQSDSINITSGITGIDLILPRDSSFGAGEISGVVELEQQNENTLSDLIIYAVSEQSGKVINYSIAAYDGSFTVRDLPFGNYRLVTQKFGFENAYSSILTIDSLHRKIEDIEINLVIASNEKEQKLPGNFTLYQNYPNPFNPSTKIKYTISAAMNVQLKVYDILGNNIATLVNGRKSAGEYEVLFSADNLPSGVYFYTLKADNFEQTKKLLLLR